MVNEKSSSTTINVAYLSATSNMNGSERSLLVLLNHLDRAKVMQRLIVVQPGPMEVAARAQGIEVVMFPWLKRPSRVNIFTVGTAVVRATRWLRANGIDIVEMNHFGFGRLVVLLLAARFAGCKVIVRWRMPGMHLRWCEKLFLSRADLILAVSEGAIAPWHHPPQPIWWLKSLKKCLRIIWDGRDIDNYRRINKRSSLTTSLGIPDNAPIVGMVGAIDTHKRQDLFLRAAEIVLKEVPEAWFVIVGEAFDKESSYPDSLTMFLKGKPLSARVVFTGYRNDAPELLKNFSLFVLPSDGDAFPGVVIEAMALSVPVIASKVDGVPEMVEDNVTGLLISQQDPRLYAEAIVRLLRNPREASRLAQSALQFAQRWDAGKIARETERMYEELIDARRRRI